jgi:hypothetical protein
MTLFLLYNSYLSSRYLLSALAFSSARCCFNRPTLSNCRFISRPVLRCPFSVADKVKRVFAQEFLSSSRDFSAHSATRPDSHRAAVRAAPPLSQALPAEAVAPVAPFDDPSLSIIGECTALSLLLSCIPRSSWR